MPGTIAQWRKKPAAAANFPWWQVGIVAVIVGTLYLAITFVPVLLVELRFRWQTFVMAIAPSGNVRDLFIPNFALDLEGQTQHGPYAVVIPALYLDEPVVYNVDPNDPKEYQVALKQGIAHAAGTAFPGQKGVGYYFAHSSLPDWTTRYNAVFSLLPKLTVGDEIVLWRNNEKYSYAVVDGFETSPQDLSFLSAEPGVERIALQTCWPLGSSARRYIILADR